MKDKRNTQLSIPLDLPPKEAKGYVAQSMRLTFASTKKVSIVAKRIMAKIFEQIAQNDLNFKPYYQIHISEIFSVDYMDSGKIYQSVITAFHELIGQAWIFENDGKTEFEIRNLFDSTKKESSTYKNGLITIALNPLLEPYLLQLVKNFTVYDLQNYMKLQSWYSVQLYEKLSSFKDTGVWQVSLEDYRKQMDCIDKYPKTKDLIKKTLSEPKKELASTPMAFKVVELKGKQAWDRGRAPVKALQFQLLKREIREIPKEWFEFSDEHKQVLEKLIAFKVTEKNIVRYAKAIGLVDARKLLREWELKEASNKRINDKAKYCNAVWAKMGKEAMDRGAAGQGAEKKTQAQKEPTVAAAEKKENQLKENLPAAKTMVEPSKTVLSAEDVLLWKEDFESIAKQLKAYRDFTFEQFMVAQHFVLEAGRWVKY